MHAEKQYADRHFHYVDSPKTVVKTTWEPPLGPNGASHWLVTGRQNRALAHPAGR